MTPRGTDWSLAALVALLAVFGGLTALAGAPGDRWVFAVHGAGGFALAGVLVFKGRRDATRRQFLTAAAVAGGSLLAWQVQRPAQRALGWRGAQRRFTGSYARSGRFPETSWVADRPKPLGGSYQLEIGGAVAAPAALQAADLDAGDTLTATLDCTGGFYATAEWRGVRLAAVLDRVGATGDHVRVISHTGYRWSFGTDDARGFLLATHVDGRPLSHGHGAPARLVAPGHRGFQWVKWVTRIEVADGPDLGAPASTVWSSFTPEGRGAA